jgi:hypothetical protein
MRRLVAAGQVGSQVAATGAILAVAVWLPLTGAAVAVLVRRFQDRHA